MRILLTGARAPVTLDLARHFHRAGHEAYLADSIRLPLARLTRAVRRTFVVAQPASHAARFVDDLMAIVRQWRIDLVVPTCEEIFYLAARHEAFSGVTRLFAEPLANLATLHNKWEFVRHVAFLAGSAHAPESHLLTCIAEVSPWIDRRDLADWVFKPVYSRFAARTLIGPSSETLRKLCPTSSDSWIAQRRIRGQEYSTYSIAQSGRLRAHACYRSAYRAGPGSGIYFLAEHEPRVREFVEQFVGRQQFTGHIGFDLIDGDDGQLYVLECNPRATSGLHLLANAPLADAFLSVDGPVLEPASAQPIMLASIMLLYPLPQALRHGGLRTLCRDMWRARDVMFRWNDPLPALLAPLSLVEVLWTAYRTRQPLTRAATFDIEWNGEPL